MDCGTLWKPAPLWERLGMITGERGTPCEPRGGFTAGLLLDVRGNVRCSVSGGSRGLKEADLYPIEPKASTY